MEDLIRELQAGARALVITGAGLSVSSGISTYRSNDSNSQQPTSKGIWNKFITQWGTRKKFLQNPLEWYNQFWLKTHEKEEYYKATPNAGHWAIAHLTKVCDNVKVITQNIDRLHLKTSIDPRNLIEVHGSLGLYKCCQKKCRYSFEKTVEGVKLNFHSKNPAKTRSSRMQKRSMNNSSSSAGSGSSAPEEEGEEEVYIKETPKCPNCGFDLLPQTLLFDELYSSHAFYNWNKVLQWIKLSDVIIFVGTSFSVGITQEALQAAYLLRKKCFNFNISVEHLPKKFYQQANANFSSQPLSSNGANEFYDIELSNILGPCEQTLPGFIRRLLLFKRTNKLRLWFYDIELAQGKLTTGQLTSEDTDEEQDSSDDENMEIPASRMEM